MYVVNSESKSTNSRVRRSPICEKIQQIAETHLINHSMRLLTPGISKAHADDAPIIRINVARNPALLLQ